MNKLYKIFQNNKTALLYSAILSLLYFGFDYSIEYSTDAYASYMDKGSWTFSFYENARLVKGVVFYILENMNLSAGTLYHLSWACAMVFMILSVTIMANVYKKYIGSEKLSTIVSFVIIANPLIIEYFLFEEKGLFILTILLNVIAVYITEYIWSNELKTSRKIWCTIGIVVLLMNAVFIYQTSVQVYVILCLPLILFHKEKLILKNVYVAAMYVVNMGAAFVVANYVMKIDRSGGNFNPIHAITAMIDMVKELTFSRFFHVGKGLFALWTAGICAVVILSVVAVQSKKLITLLSYLYIMFITVVASVLIFAISGSAIPSPRTTHSYGMLFGITLVYFFYLYNEKELKVAAVTTKMSYALSIFIIATILVVNFISFEKVFVDRYKCNEADRYYAQIIREQIRQYEDETGNTVDTICFYSDAYRTWYDQGYGDTELMSRAQSCGWSRLTSINLYLDRNYVEGEQDPELVEYFESQDWGMYSEKQVVFKDNKLHLCIY